jgi:hypothetical protein
MCGANSANSNPEGRTPPDTRLLGPIMPTSQIGVGHRNSTSKGHTVGLLWRLLAPKPVKKARRTVHRATHPVSLITPKPIKKARRAASTVIHPFEAMEFGIENKIVRTVRGSSRKRTSAEQGSPLDVAFLDVPFRLKSRFTVTRDGTVTDTRPPRG